MDYLVHITILCSIYATLTLSLNLLVGQLGVLSLAHAAFYGFGAYTVALLSIHYRPSFFITQLGAIALVIPVALIVAMAAGRLSSDYVALATFGFHVIFLNVVNNWIGLTNGPLGLAGIPPPELMCRSIRHRGGILLLAIGLMAVAWIAASRISRSPFGRVLRAIREDEAFAQSLGKNTLRFKTRTFCLTSALAASAGGLYAQYMTFVDPTSFGVAESILLVSMVIVGGPASSLGAVTGAFFLVVLPEGLRFLGLPSASAAQLRQVTYGALLVVAMVARPNGLVGKYKFGR
jgi:branched-chain amino acid transport system permease protein